METTTLSISDAAEQEQHIDRVTRLVGGECDYIEQGIYYYVH